MLMRFLDVGGSQTRFIHAGDPENPPLLLLHGLALSAEVWLRNIDALAKRRHVVAVDMLGHGFTRPCHGGPVDIPAKLAHLKAFIDLLGLRRPAICGSSYGALIGTLLSLAHEGLVERLVINGSGSCFNSQAQLSEQVERLHALYQPTLTRSTPQMWRERLAPSFFDPGLIPPELLFLAPLSYAQPWAAECWAGTMAELRDADRFRPFRILERLEQVATPTLVAWGRQDRGGILESAEAAVRRMPDARLEVFDACGHYPMLEHPVAFNRLVADFLAE